MFPASLITTSRREATLLLSSSPGRRPSVARRSARKRRRSYCGPWMLAFGIAAILGCRSAQTQPSPVAQQPAQQESKSDEADAGPPAYPAARWRLASPDALTEVVLWVSHILIRYDRSDRDVPFALLSWSVEPPPPPRSRADALKLANFLAARAAAEPETFATLARQYSEDIVTSPQGGSLAGIAASRLASTPGVLDAIATLRPGEVSRVVETRHGFHILLRRPPPALETISARRLLVPYDGAPLADRTGIQVGRSREQALEIARHAADSLRADPNAFPPLLAQYSPSADPEDDGDIGMWTNREPGLWLNRDPGPLEREREQIAGVEVGAVTDPIDGLSGFQVFVRTPLPTERIEYLVQLLQLPTIAAEADAQSGGDAGPRWQAAAKKLSKNRGEFDDLRRYFCCADSQRWSHGRVPSRFLRAVASLQAEQISARPVNDDGEPFFLFAKKLDPATSERPPATLFELPDPKTTDVERVALRAGGAETQEFIGKLADGVSPLLGLGAESAARIKRLHAELAAALRTGDSEEKRKEALASFRFAMRHELTATQYAQYQDFVSERLSSRVMGP
jgi:hypothetical protein